MYVRYKITIFLIFISSLFLMIYFMTNILLTFLAYAITILYILWGLYHIIILLVGSRKPQDNTYNELILDYPKISLIIPAKGEFIISRTIESLLLHTDYPSDKKEIIIVTEDDEIARIALYYQYRYPENVKLLFRKAYFPTKPSALNDALILCTGKIIGIVDVEDILEYDLLKKVAYALEIKRYDIVQTLLLIDNAQDSWISKCFGMEYAGWFRLWLNGRARLELYTPLGGTGNYIKRSALYEVGRWDSLNLAEDAELAIRLMLSGKKTCVIDARQWEEAPTTFRAWLKQRTRWYRGWLQSLWKYSLILIRISTIKRIGLINVIATFCMLIAPLVVALSFIAYSLTLLWLFEYSKIISTTLTNNLFPSYAILPLLFNFIYYSTWIYGSNLEGKSLQSIRFGIKDIPFMFIYINIMMPLAAWRAIYQSIFKEVYWEKTRHYGKGVKWNVINTVK